MHDNTTAKHIAQSCDRFTVAIGILKRLGEMLCNKQCEVGIVRVLFGVLVTVSVYGDDAIGVLINNRAARIHTEGANLVAIFRSAINDLAFIKLVG